MKAKWKENLPDLLLTLAFFVGLCVCLYPSLSNWWNERYQSRVISVYDETVAQKNAEELAEELAVIEEYNSLLASMDSRMLLADPTILDGLIAQPQITDIGMIGYVTIQKLGVELSIYYGTTSSVLSSGAGLMDGTSIPIAGESTHAVIVAHRGLPSATLFTHLDELEIGDTFTVTILKQVYTYQVDQIKIVTPDVLDDLRIVQGEEYCTLLTCTPYGINTHRLLVRGKRIDIEEVSDILVTEDGYVLPTALSAAMFALPVMALWGMWVMIRNKTKRK